MPSNKPYPTHTPYIQSDYTYDSIKLIHCYYCNSNILLNQVECPHCYQVNPFHSSKLHLLNKYGKQNDNSGNKPSQLTKKASSLAQDNRPAAIKKPYPKKTPYTQSDYRIDNHKGIRCYYCESLMLLNQVNCPKCGQVNPFHSTKLYLLGDGQEHKTGLQPGQPVRVQSDKKPTIRIQHHRSHFSGAVEQKFNEPTSKPVAKKLPLIDQSDSALNADLNQLKQTLKPTEAKHRKDYLAYRKIDDMTSPYNMITFFSGLIGLFNINNELGAFSFLVAAGITPFYFFKKSHQNKLLPEARKKSNESFEKEQSLQEQIKSITAEIEQRDTEKEFLNRLNKQKLNTRDMVYMAPSKGALMYYLRLSDGHYKIGITGRSIKERFKGGERKRFTVVAIWRFDKEKAAYRYESAVLHTFRRYKPRNYTSSNLQSGHSEVFNKNILRL